MYDKETFELMLQHLKEGDHYRSKVDMLEANQKNIIRALSKGDGNFDILNTKLTEIAGTTIILKNTILGNGRTGLCAIVEKNSQNVAKALTNCKGVILEKELEEQKETIKKHEKFIERLIGAILLIRIAGVMGIIYVITNLINYIPIIFTGLKKIIITYFGG